MTDIREQLSPNQQESAPDFYIGDVVEFQGDKCICDITVGSVVIRQYFSAELMANHGLASGNMFIWYPTEDGSVNEQCIVPVLDEDFSQYEDQELSGFKAMRDRMWRDFLFKMVLFWV